MSLLHKIGHVLKSVGKVAAPIIGSAIGSPLLGAAIGGLVSGHAAGKAAKAQSSAANAAAGQYANALNASTQYQQPYLDAGSPAINALMKVNSGDYSGFDTSPDYLYARDQALSGVENSASARGGLYSGNTGRRLAEVASGLASQNLGNYRNALMGQIGIGQSAANNLGNAQFNAAGGASNALLAGGDARASGIVGKSNALTGVIDQFGSYLGDYYGSKKKPKPLAQMYGGGYG